jgi:hypothetical protein
VARLKTSRLCKNNSRLLSNVVAGNVVAKCFYGRSPGRHGWVYVLEIEAVTPWSMRTAD